jgi:transcriptional regulator of acetoin/glycerol metabolism
VGEVKVRRVDLRVVAATHRDLRSMVEAGLFRSDLYQRLNAFEVTLPPLRERPKDLEALMARLLAGVPLAAEARRLLRAYPWPGNVRELVGALESARVLAEGAARIEAEHLPPSIRLRAVAAPRPARYRDVVREAKRAAIVDALSACGGNRTRAAGRLGISRQTLLTEMRALGVS